MLDREASKRIKMRELPGIPDDLKVLALAPFVYPAEEPSPHGKKSLKEVAHYDRF